MCALHQHARTPGIPTTLISSPLNPSARRTALFIVGQNPGLKEDECGIPFVGPSGETLRGPMLTGMNAYALADIYLTNMARCGPESDVPASSYRTCSLFLRHDLKAVCETHSRTFVFLLGGPASHHFYLQLCGLKGINLRRAMSRNGEVREWEAHTITVFATYHPAYVGRRRNQMITVADHCQLVADALLGIPAVPSNPNIQPPMRPRHERKF